MLPTPHPDVIFRELSEGGVLLHTEQEVYFGLNSVGVEVWKLLPPARGSFDDVCRVVHGRYPAEKVETIRADVKELLADLIEMGLLVSAESADELIPAS